VILDLADDPRPSGVRKLASLERVYRLRVGAYRVIYEIYDDRLLVLVLQVARRSESTYRDV
jgi:mRNA interferase RelE/StbE